MLRAGDIELDRATRRVTRGRPRDQSVADRVPPARAPDAEPRPRLFSRAQLLDAVWGRDVYVDERTVDVHVGRLRKAHPAAASRDPIRTVRGMGYSFDERFTAT